MTTIEREHLDSLLASHRPGLRRWAGGRLPRYARESADTEDLVQDAMIGAARHVATLEQRDDEGVQAYLRRAVINRIRDELRRVQSRPRREELVDDAIDDEPSPFDCVIASERRGFWEGALATLDATERKAVISRVELSCSYREIAALIGKPSADAARMIVARALVKLARRTPAGRL